MARKYLIMAILAALAAVGALSVSPVLATGSGQQPCPDGNCQVIPAVQTVTTNTDSSSVSTTTTTEVVTLSIEKMVRQYETTHNVIVAINQKPGGVKSLKGCIDPVRKGWIKIGGAFQNTRYGGSHFWDSWKLGRKICNPVRVKIGGKWYMKGTKDNCGNRDILIQISGPRVRHVIKKVKVFRTVKQFKAVYKAWAKTVSSSSTTQTVTTSVTYSCPTGWTPINGGTQCQKCEKTQCLPPPPPPPKPHVLIVKMIKVDGVVSTPGNGMFSFHVTGGGLNTTVTNLAPSRDAGTAAVGSTVTVCEVQPQDYNPEGGLCQTGKVTPNGLTFTFVNVKTKDSTDGPGAGTPGQPGGPGAGGDPAPPQDPGTLCRNQSGDIVPGSADQFGYCIT